ncbi:tungsten ABC transporter permease, partial [Azotobacter chroococcum]|nr:tungsten ABC transporter permease [Azotobacter chroococcum]
ILLRGDRRMRRAYVALEPGPAHPASAAAREGARRVVDYLVSPAGQANLAAADGEAGGPWIYGLAEAPPALSAGRGAASPASPRH